MLSFDINWFAIILLVVVNIGIGAVWYGPMFGKAWMAEVGLSMEDVESGNMTRAYSFAFFNSLIMAFVLANVVKWTAADTILDGLLLGLIMWLGFTGFSSGVNHAFEGRSTKLWLIHSSMYLVGLMIMGMVLVVWP